MKLTIGYITSRPSPRLEWFFDSLKRQTKPDDEIEIIIVDKFAGDDARTENHKRLAGRPIIITAPKPTIWQGKYRITSEDWWAASNSRNTVFCLASHPWVACLDDRCVLLPNWLNCVRDAQKHGYAVCGTYEKGFDLVVENGHIVSFVEPRDETGKLSAKDSRLNEKGLVMTAPNLCPPNWFFGCSFALPLEWVWAVNGQDETCDGLSMEDVIFGLMLKNNGYPICFDPRMRIVEDRTPNQIGSPMRREDKGKSPDDKSHAMLAMLRDSKRAMHHWDLKKISEQVKAGQPFPEPEKKKYFDWYDGELIGPDYMRKTA